MTPAELSFAMETAGLTLIASGGCATAASIAGTVAVVHWTSEHRPRGKGWITIGGLVLATIGLSILSYGFFTLP